MALSIASARTHSSSKSNKALLKKPDVDESLFGNKRVTSAKGTNRKEELEKLTQELRTGELKNPNAAVITPAELVRMKNMAVTLTKDEQIYQKKILEEQNEKMMAAAKAKKQKMLQLEAEKKKSIPLSESDYAEKTRSEGLHNRAQELLNEQLDEVKHMNQLLLSAKIVTIRDTQLTEKKEIREQRKIEEKRKDLMMEVERLKKVKYYEELEREKKEEIRKGSSVVIDQIKERELERLKLQEEKEREGQEIIKHMRILQKEEADNALKRKARIRDMQTEIYEANQRAIVSKQVKIDAEKAEEEKIVKYNIEKAQKEAEYLAEQQRIKEEKEREVARLREMQEKASDRQAELDALRAKRAVELADRQAREKERKEAEQRARINQELFEARKLQSMEKELRLQEQARVDRDEFQKIITAQKIEKDIEVKLEQERIAKIKEHAEQLKKQIVLGEEKRHQDKRTALEEGKKVKDKLDNERRTLENLKFQKLKELQLNGVPEKYQRDLAKKRINV